MSKLMSSQFQHVLIGAGLFFGSLIIYSFNINHGFYVDELYHLLPAHSLLTDGTLAVGNGEYVRAELYTRFIAVLLSVFGESPSVARYSSAITSSIFIVTVYFLLSKLIGRKEALVSALVLVILPSSIYLAQFIRFYALHQLFCLIGLVGAYYLVTSRLTLLQQFVLSVTSLASLGLAYYLQVTTILACMAFAGWFVFYLIFNVWDVSTRSKKDIILLVFTIAAGSALILLLIVQGKFATLLSEFRYAAPWSADNADNYVFYHQLLRYQYPTFWTLFPFACFVALLSKPKPAFFFICLFTITLFLFSLGGMKDERYIIFLYPYFVGIWSICAVFLLGKLSTLMQAALSKHLPFRVSTTNQSKIVSVLMLCAGGFVLLGNHAFPISFHMLNGQQYRHEIGNWSLAHDKVAPLINEADVVLTSNDVESLYYFGTYDFNYNDYIFNESKDQQYGKEQGQVNADLILDKRTGLPVLGGIQLFEKVLACYSRGVFLGDERKWYKDGQGIGEQGVALLSKKAIRVELDPEARLVVYSWENLSVLPESDCQALYQFKRNRAIASKAEKALTVSSSGF